MVKLKASQTKITKKKMAEYKENQQSAQVQDPDPGWYDAHVAECKVEEKKRKKGVKQLAVAYQVDNHPTFEGAWVWERVPLPEELGGDMTDRNEWKYIQFFTAVGELDPDKGGTVNSDTDSLKSRSVLLRVRGGEYNGEYRAEVGSVLPPPEKDSDSEEEEDEEEFDEAEEEEDDEEDADEEEELDDEDFDEDEEDEDDEEEEGEQITSEYIDSLSGPELKELLKENGIKRPSGMKKVREVRDFAKDQLIGVPF